MDSIKLSLAQISFTVTKFCPWSNVEQLSANSPTTRFCTFGEAYSKISSKTPFNRFGKSIVTEEKIRVTKSKTINDFVMETKKFLKLIWL